ncbi:MAG: transcription elongation factor GreB [Chromatiales bacterium]
MGRWRPPSPNSSPYITPEGYHALQEELHALWTRRAEVVKHLAAAAAEGDRSENAEYIYRKKELREIDWRIGYLQKRMPKLKVISRRPDDPERVFFGAWVRMEDSTGTEVVFRIVGADETDAAKGYISVDSPLGGALLKKTFDEEVIVHSRRGQVRYVIIDIRYEERREH